METLITPYSLPLTIPPFKREGLIVRLKDGSGREGWGEMAPLPGWSKETLRDILHRLDPRFPSCTFALQSAREELENPLPSFSLPLSALLMGTAEEMLALGKKAIAEGFTSAKVKVGQLSFDQAKQLIDALRSDLFLRIDVNKAWTLKQAVTFFSHFPDESFESVEDPVQNEDDLAHFPFPFAIDGIPTHWDFPNLKAVVLKPTFCGDIRPIAEEAKARGKKVILSGVFESGVGTAAIASLAYRLGLDRDPVGLDTYRYLKGDIRKTPLIIRGGRIEVPACRRCLTHPE